MYCLIVCLLLWSAQCFAGDIIGNGGGVWSCGDSAQSSRDILLVDFYEAETEWQWQLKKYESFNHGEILREIKQDLDSEFSSFSRGWSSRLDGIVSKINYIEGELEIIDDALYRSRPNARLCPGAEWTYLQFANYTKFDSILVQNDIWNSSQVSPMERAGLIVHEAIYEWFREVYADKNSSRARIVVGLIFAEMPIEEKRQRLLRLLGRDRPPRETGGIMCMYTGLFSGRFYTGVGESENLAWSAAQNACVEEDSFPDHCQRFFLPCERVKSGENRWVCTQEHAMTRKIYSEEGRTKIEAVANTHNACIDSDFEEGVHCEEPKCERLRR